MFINFININVSLPGHLFVKYGTPSPSSPHQEEAGLRCVFSIGFQFPLTAPRLNTTHN